MNLQYDSYFIKNACVCLCAKKKDWKEKYQDISSGGITGGSYFFLLAFLYILNFNLIYPILWLQKNNKHYKRKC